MEFAPIVTPCEILQNRINFRLGAATATVVTTDPATGTTKEISSIEFDEQEYIKAHSNFIIKRLKLTQQRLNVAISTCPYISMYYKHVEFPELLQSLDIMNKVEANLMAEYRPTTSVIEDPFQHSNLDSNLATFQHNCAANDKMIQDYGDGILETMKSSVLSVGLYFPVHLFNNNDDPKWEVVYRLFAELLRPQYLKAFEDDLAANAESLTAKVIAENLAKYEADSIISSIKRVVADTLKALDICKVSAENLNNWDEFNAHLNAIGLKAYEEFHKVCILLYFSIY